MATHYEYQVVTHVPEDDEWEDQELVSGVLTKEEAMVEVAKPIDRRYYPEGTTCYIEVRSYTDWERL